MGLGPETDNNEYALCLAGLDCLVASRCSSVLAHLDWSHVSLLSALLSFCHQQTSGDRGTVVPVS